MASTQVSVLTVIMAGLLTAPAGAEPPATVKDAPPVVVKTEPRAGDTDVDAAKVTEIRVTFSKDMADGSWSWSRISKETFPTTTGKPHYDADKRTCVLPVKLEPGKAYVIWLNPEKFKSFRDTDGHPAVFYPLVFETKK
jgi:Bacterial Ig-like domain